MTVTIVLAVAAVGLLAYLVYRHRTQAAPPPAVVLKPDEWGTVPHKPKHGHSHPRDYEGEGPL